MTKNKVLIPLDGSRFSLQILSYVKRFLNATENELILLYVAETPNRVSIKQPGAEDLTIYADLGKAAIRTKLSAEKLPYIRELNEAGFTVSTAVCFGEPTAEIERFINEAQIDLVAMTTHGRTGLSRILFGSVALHLLHHMTVPILLYGPLSNADPTEVSG